jgi:hypothetical protein
VRPSDSLSPPFAIHHHRNHVPAHPYVTPRGYNRLLPPSIRGGCFSVCRPHELDFELVGPRRLELEFGPRAIQVLTQFTAHTKRLKYSTIVPAGTMRRARDTRIDGRTVVCVPYIKKHVALVQRWMELPAMCIAFGVNPPSLKSEQRAQAMMAKDKACHAFVVCTKVDVGREECPVHPEGRAHIVVVAPSVAQVRSCIIPDTLTLLLPLYWAKEGREGFINCCTSSTVLNPGAPSLRQLWCSNFNCCVWRRCL